MKGSEKNINVINRNNNYINNIHETLYMKKKKKKEEIHARFTPK